LNSVDRVYIGQNGSYSMLSLSYVDANVGVTEGFIGKIVLDIDATVLILDSMTTASTVGKIATTSKTNTMKPESNADSNQGPNRYRCFRLFS